MPAQEDSRRATDALLSQAATATNMAERSRLIDQAVRLYAMSEPEPRAPAHRRRLPAVRPD
jgi:hypothetical protein